MCNLTYQHTEIRREKRRHIAHKEKQNQLILFIFHFPIEILIMIKNQINNAQVHKVTYFTSLRIWLGYM